MTPSGKTTLVALLTVAGLGLTSCSADDDAPAAEQSDLDSLLATDARGDQRAAGGATAMAMELGFEQVQAASESEIESGPQQRCRPRRHCRRAHGRTRILCTTDRRVGLVADPRPFRCGDARGL